MDDALTSVEIKNSLDKMDPMTSDLLRHACQQQQDRMWRDLGEAGTEFDDVSARHERLEALPPPVLWLRWAATSAVVHIVLATAGSMLLALSFLDGGPSSAGFLAHTPLLVTSVILGAVAVLAVVLRRLLLANFLFAGQRLPRIILESSPVLLSIGSFVLFYCGVINVVTEQELTKSGGSDHADAYVLISVVIGVLFAIPITLGAARLTTPVRRWLLVTATAALLIIVVSTPLALQLIDGTGSVAVDIGFPDFFLVFWGEVSMTMGTLLSLAGVRATTTGAVRAAYHAVRARVSEELTESYILPFLRTDISRRLDDYSALLDVHDAPGLSQVFDPLYRVPTVAAAKVDKLIKGMPGGSIGLAGARGSGKTTLLEACCEAGLTAAGVAVVVAAPVEYSAREFILHLYAKVCERIAHVDGDRLRLMAGRARRRIIMQSLLLTFAGVTTMSLGLLWTILPDELDIKTGQLVAVGFIFVGVVVFMTGFVRGMVAQRYWRGPASLEELAGMRLEEIRFQQSFSTTATGTVKLSVGVEAAVSRGRSLTRQPMTLPEVVDSLRDFLEAVAREHDRVMIGIDELDKMRSEAAAEQFLNDIKGIFGIRNCYFVVSVSEEAMSTFERRGLPFRDVFDSTFDEIVWFEHLTTAEAITTMDRRVVMPIPFKQLCYTLSGGLPRDLIRVARTIIADQAPSGLTDLATITATTVLDELKRKARAMAVAVRRTDPEPQTGQILLICDSTQKMQSITVDGVRNLITALAVGPHSAIPSPLQTLAAELGCFYYYLATVLEFFTDTPNKERWQQAGRGADNDRALVNLARARQAFSTSSRVAWAGVSRFREAWDMDTMPDPINPQPAAAGNGAHPATTM
ncbi:P-loop NTPase fold protein [Actinophytocola sp.]|uniref:P-loop NTPase fold protein n=1 Tax=Actinophytocola sp. TaxID=1872138 RepID=UPI00389AFA93